VTNWPPLAWPIVGRNGDFDAELVRPVGLALADAFDLRCVKGKDLRPALTLLLLAHAPRQRRQLYELPFGPLLPLILRAMSGITGPK